MFEKEEGIRFKIREGLKALTALLIILWLFKGWLKLEAYNEEIVWAIIGLIILIEILGVGRWIGVTISGVIFSLAKAAFLISLFLFFGKWLGLPKDFPVDAKTAFAYSIVLGIAGLLVARFDFPATRKGITPKVEKKAYEFDGFSYKGVTLSGKGKVYPIKLGRKRVGWAIEGDVIVEAKTPLGTIRRKLIDPVVIWSSINIGSRRTSPNQAFIDTVNSLLGTPITYIKEGSSIDLGIIKVYEGDNFTYVKLPFLEVIDTPHGEEVKIGPFKIRDGRIGDFPRDVLTIQELRNGFRLTIMDDRVTIVTEDFKIEASKDRILYKSGDERLTLGERYVSLSSGDISISVGRGTGKIRIEDTVISASNGKVKIRINGKSYVIESKEAFNLVLRKAKEIVEEQAEDVIEGLGIDRSKLSKRIKELIDELMEQL
ncbi:hypothetical protein PNA2_1807 [Pyrococcus sp. NA2]|uniref:hypothetical protein n=1 Tax=Pyrococcus sp. (strain NA2) TaxID=342949 RepID=UPI000209AC04|nr:hypothetical protein PNA2_1807 [Pyrococcus sp. NA2]